MMQLHLDPLHVEGVHRVGGDDRPVLLEGHHEVVEVQGPGVALLGGQSGGVEPLGLRRVDLLPVHRRHAHAVQGGRLQRPHTLTVVQFPQLFSPKMDDTRC